MVTTSGRPWRERSLRGRAASLVQVESRWKRELSERSGSFDEGMAAGSWMQQGRLVAVVGCSAVRVAEMETMAMRAMSDFIAGRRGWRVFIGAVRSVR